MTDALKLKNKILKILQTTKPEEIKPQNKDVKFAFKITPFEIPNFVVVIEYFHKIDMIRLAAIIGMGKNLMASYKKKNQAEKIEIMSLFTKPIRARNFNAIIPQDFSALNGHKLFFPQNMSSQMLYDAVSEAIFLLQDLWELLYQADQSLQAPQISETSKHMFQ